MNLKLTNRIVRNKVTLWLTYARLLTITGKLNKDSVVFDCGANVGDITAKFAATGALVHAFEPDPLAFAALQEKLGSKPNVILHKEGVWDQEADINLYSHKDQFTENKNKAFTVSSSIVDSKVNIDKEKAQSIHVIDLSHFITHFGRHVDIIKLDVEGAEIAILKKIINDGAYAYFGKMFVETHETKIPGQKDEVAAIRSLMELKNVNNIKLNWL